MPNNKNKYMEELNTEQIGAVENLLGPLLVLAGAGTGKTRVLTTRLSHILRLNQATPSQIFAVTFTNKAANEMRERVESILGRSVAGWWLGTFHSLAALASSLGCFSHQHSLTAPPLPRLLRRRHAGGAAGAGAGGQWLGFPEC